MDEKNKNALTKFYNDIINLNEIEIYKSNKFQDNELFNYKNSKTFFIHLCISNLLKSINILKNYILIILINKAFVIEYEIIKNIVDIYNVFESDFNEYIKKLKIVKKKGKNQENNNKIIIDNLSHEFHIDIRITFLEIILKNVKNIKENQEILVFLMNNILLSEDIFDIEDKKRFADFTFNKFSIKKKLSMIYY